MSAGSFGVLCPVVHHQLCYFYTEITAIEGLSLLLVCSHLLIFWSLWEQLSFIVSVAHGFCFILYLFCQCLYVDCGDLRTMSSHLQNWLLVLFIINLISKLCKWSLTINNSKTILFSICYVPGTLSIALFKPHKHACMLSHFSCVWLFVTLDCSLPSFCVRGILQARIVEWVAMPSSRGSSRPGHWTHVSYVSCMCRQVLYH